MIIIIIIIHGLFLTVNGKCSVALENKYINTFVLQFFVISDKNEVNIANNPDSNLQLG